MNWITRARLFARDYLNEFGVAWSIARHRDCERNGGHRWGPIETEPMAGLMRTCGRCGTGEMVSRTHGTAATKASFMTVYRDGSAATKA